MLAPPTNSSRILLSVRMASGLHQTQMCSLRDTQPRGREIRHYGASLLHQGVPEQFPASPDGLLCPGQAQGCPKPSVRAPEASREGCFNLPSYTLAHTHPQPSPHLVTTADMTNQLPHGFSRSPALASGVSFPQSPRKALAIRQMKLF